MDNQEGLSMLKSPQYRDNYYDRGKNQIRIANADDVGWLPKDPNHMTSQEQRKLNRLRRKKGLELILNKKPDKEILLESDISSLEEAKVTIGDYKLKSESTYIVPKEQRLNATQKWQQIYILEENIEILISEYNKKIISLRNTKKNIIDEMKVEYYFSIECK